MEIFGIIGGLALGYIVVKAWDVEQANKKAKKDLAKAKQVEGCVFACVETDEEIVVHDVYLDGTKVIIEVEHEGSDKIYTYGKQTFEDKFQIAL